MTGALAGVRVVDFGQGLAAPLVAMILGDNGADVIRVDPPGGPRWDHPSNAALQRSKRNIALDLKTAGDLRIARALVERADVLVEGFRPGVMTRFGLGPTEMTEANSRLVYCSLPGFAGADPRADLAAWEGIVGAATAHYAATARGQDEPVFSALPLASSFAGFVAVNSILASLIARHRSGLGQMIEVPLFSAMFEAFGGMSQRLPVPPKLPFHAATDIDARCSDGRWVHLVIISRRHHRWLFERFLPDLAGQAIADPVKVFEDPLLAMEARERIVDLLATKPAAEWDRLINDAGIPITICNTTEEWLRGDDHARASGAVIEVDDPVFGPTVQAGFPVSLSVTPCSVQSPRHVVDADREAILAELAHDDLSTRPPEARQALGSALEGTQVVDLTMILAGPSAGRILAEFGAEVIKINKPAFWIIGHLHTNSGKRTALVDIGTQEGLDVLWPLVERADVFLQNFPKGTADRLGVGEADVRAHRPDIVYSTVSAYGHDGPRGAYRGWEPIGQAATGIMMRRGGDKPAMAGFPVCDYGTGHLSAMAVLLGLYHRATTGEGQRVASSLVQAGTYHQLPFMIAYEGATWDEPRGNDSKGWSVHDRLYQAGDGWLYLVAAPPDGAHRLASVDGLVGVDVTDAAALADVLRTEPVETWVSRLRAVGVAAHELVGPDDLFDDAWVRANGLVVVRDHPGVGSVTMVGPTPRLSRTPVRLTAPAPLPGAHTKEIVVEAGGRDAYADLLAHGVVAESLPGDVMLSL